MMFFKLVQIKAKNRKEIEFPQFFFTYCFSSNIIAKGSFFCQKTMNYLYIFLIW